jgi:serine/threonine-protein kinase
MPEAARRSYEEAASLDPALAAAHLRLARLTILARGPTRSREYFQKANAGRASLSDRDRALLDAFEPVIRGDIPDYPELERRLVAATERYPNDAELHAILGETRAFTGQMDEARAALDRAISLDPKYSEAWRQKASVEQYAGTREGALAAVEHCLSASSDAGRCLDKRIWINAQLGRCDDVARDARRANAIAPSTWRPYLQLASAELALGKPREAAFELLRQYWKLMPEDDRRSAEPEDLADLSIFSGDFADAEKHLAELDRAVASSTALLDHEIVAWLSTELYREIGDTTRAASVAKDLMARRAAWQSKLGPNDFAVGADMTPVMLSALGQAGAITEADHASRIEAWANGWQARLARAYHPYVWIYGHARSARTREQAEAALAALPRYGPIPWYRAQLGADAHIGRAFLLAGRAQEALPYLENASSSCLPFQDPFAWVQANAWLGEAREKTGDVAGACGAYARLLSRWGGAPRSVTSRYAKARIAALKCK